MIKLILSLFVPFKSIIKRMGANYTQFIKILKLKLTLDNRRPSSFNGNSSKENSSSLVWQFLMMLIIGLIILIITTKLQDSFTLFFVGHSMLMLTISMLIISEFSTILLNTSDNTILQPLPISSTTLSLARNAHIFIHLMFSALSLLLPVSVQIAIQYGIGSMAAFVFALILNVIFTLFLSNLMYLGIMRFAKGDKLKNLLMYFQVFMAILFMAIYQLSLNMLDTIDFSNITIATKWYTYIIPSTYFAGLTEMFSSLNFSANLVILSLVAIALPPLGLFTTGKYLTPIFNKKLSELEQSDKSTSQTKSRTLANFLSKIFSFNEQERSSFVMTWRLIGRERLFLQTILPTFGYILFFMVFPFFKDFEGLTSLAETSKYFIILYSFCFVSASFSSAMSIGNNKGVGWLLRSLPIESPHHFFSGAMKSVFVRFLTPFYIAINLGVIAIWGTKVIVDIAVAFMVIYLTICTAFLVSPKKHPFSSDKKSNSSASTFVIFILVMASTIALGFIHYYGAQEFKYFPLILILVYGFSIYLVQTVIFKKFFTWKALDLANSH
ncbi:hypothetical protein [Perlabentimonas gracilis]|uniref:hypothetical protein n=1 Tax=Perlabentimonas gracilis TaxID=2715279 RepID=UPI00140C4F1E|nr:hypothetical protein [Perlabentimonas gracilis]NHB67904.1 hypothetical protein [Perlabentimonas gracilis]